MALQESMREYSTSTFELIRCKLTLFYDYWQMNEVFLTQATVILCVCPFVFLCSNLSLAYGGRLIHSSEFWTHECYTISSFDERVVGLLMLLRDRKFPHIYAPLVCLQLNRVTNKQLGRVWAGLSENKPSLEISLAVVYLCSCFDVGSWTGATGTW